MPSDARPIGRLLATLPVLAVVVLVAIAGRSLWFYSDDWNIYVEYNSGNLLEPFNGHLSLVPAGLYQLAFHTVGVGSYWPYRAFGMVGLALLGFQIVRLAGTRVGWWAAAIAATAVLGNEAGNTNLMFPFLMNFSIPLAALLAIWWHLDAADRQDGDDTGGGSSGIRHEAAASAWLAVALGTSGLGLMALGAVGAELAVSRAPLRRWLIMAPGAVLWSAWFVTHRDASAVSTDIGAVVSYAGRMLLGGTTSLAAGWAPGGAIVLVGLAGYVVVAAVRWRSLDGRSLGALVAPLLFIGLTAVSRLDITPRIEPDELRYRWTIAAYLVMAVVMMWRPPAHDRQRLRPAAPYAGAAVALILAAGVAQLGRGISTWVDQVETAEPGLRSSTFATEAVGSDRVDPDVVLPLSFVLIRTGGYLDAVAAVGSPIAGLDPRSFRGPPDQDLFSDRLLAEQLPVVATPSARPCTDAVDAGRDVRVRPGSTLTLRAPSGANGATAIVSRFGAPGDGPSIALPEGVSTLVVPDDAAAVAAVGRRLDYRVVGSPGTAVCR